MLTLTDAQLNLSHLKMKFSFLSFSHQSLLFFAHFVRHGIRSFQELNKSAYLPSQFTDSLLKSFDFLFQSL
ncbi:MAG TPA: hypothetical protein PLL36_04555 [Candidatus Hydrogenedentes bacterium]|nr:hypothetical protein [Candidatus Hydrogenedentota bacterium]